MNTYRIQIEGLVQGVGFRPFIYRLANTLKFSGTVENRNNGVFIYVNTNPEDLDNLIVLIKLKISSSHNFQLLQVAIYLMILQV